MTGVSIGQLATGTIPEPTHRLEWGDDMPADVLAALLDGETAMLYGVDGEPYALILIDSSGTMRQRRIEIDP